MAGVTYDVGADGNAPKGVGVGDFVRTGGGTFQVLDGSQYKGMSPEQLSGAGVGYNPSNGLYSRKVSNTKELSLEQQFQPMDVGFNTDAWKENYLNKVVSGLDANYATDKSNIQKTYNTNKAQYDKQIKDTNKLYEQNIAQLQKDAYINNILSKQQASSRGLTSSAQGIALSQSGLNRANEQSVNLWKSKTETVNDIQSAMNLLYSNYNIDLDTLQSRYNADKLGAMSDAELQALDKQLQIDIANIDAYNNWNMTQYGTLNSNQQSQLDRDLKVEQAELDRAFQLQEAEKDRELQKYLASLSGSSYGGGGGYGGYSRSGSNSSGSKVNAEYEDGLVQNYHNYLNDVHGNWRGLLNATQRQSIDDAALKVGNGKMTRAEYEKLTNAHIAAAKRSISVTNKSSNSSSSKKQTMPDPKGNYLKNLFKK